MGVPSAIEDALKTLKDRDPDQKTFHQAAEEALNSLGPLIEKRPELGEVLPRLLESERVIIFRVPWRDDKGNARVNRGFRVQHNSAIGPYKGGLRFHPSVKLDILKFLALEQTFKNSLTSLPLGGGKGGADINPKDMSEREIETFCQSFMTELVRHVGHDTDVPAGDIGVGGREIGFLFGQHKRLTNTFTGVLTGKGLQYGGSLLRPEATGFGVVFFTRHMLEASDKELKGMRVAVSGSGNVATFAARKLLDEGATPVTLSDSGGTLYAEDGIDSDLLDRIMELKNKKRGRLADLDKLPDGVKFHKDKAAWQAPGLKCDIAMPAATQNELDEDDVEALDKAGVKVVVEAANMPCTAAASKAIAKNKWLFAPAKAANAGGVAVSGLEMAQNSQRVPWTADEVEEKLRSIMKDIFGACRDAAEKYGDSNTDYAGGANVAGFIKVAEAMLAQGNV